LEDRNRYTFYKSLFKEKKQKKEKRKKKKEKKRKKAVS